MGDGTCGNDCRENTEEEQRKRKMRPKIMMGNSENVETGYKT